MFENVFSGARGALYSMVNICTTGNYEEHFAQQIQASELAASSAAFLTKVLDILMNATKFPEAQNNDNLCGEVAPIPRFKFACLL